MDSRIPEYCMEKRKKILIIRGKNLNPWDMQMYEPLRTEFDLMALLHPRNRFNTADINIPKYQLSDIKNFIFNPSSVLKSHKKYNFYNYELRKILKDIDIVHTAELFTNYTNSVCNLKKEYNYKIVSTVWENIPWKTVHDETSQMIRLSVEKHIDKIIVPTESSRDALLMEGISKEKIVQIFPGFNLEKFKLNKADNYLKNDLKISEEDFVILYIGRMVYQKGIFDILAAAKLLLHDKELHNRNLKFIMIGNGKELKTVRNLLNAYNILENFILIEKVDYGRITDYYNIADAFICPSIPEKNWQEQFGMVFAESMASGVVPVGTKTGAIPEVIGNAGLLALPANYFDLAAKIKNLIIDKKLRNELINNGIKRVEQEFNYKKQAEKLSAVYCNILQ